MSGTEFGCATAPTQPREACQAEPSQAGQGLTNNPPSRARIHCLLHLPAHHRLHHFLSTTGLLLAYDRIEPKMANDEQALSHASIEEKG